MFTQKNVEKQSLDYFNGNSLASSVWVSKYALKDKDGNFLEETPNDMHRRMAKEFHKKIKQNKYSHFVTEDEIFELLKDFKYIIPGGSIMSQLGNGESFGSLSNCTVIDRPEDSYGGILHTDQMLAQLMKRRCGVGTDISSLRPSGSVVSNAAGSSTGMASFAERFSNTTREVAQDGRRGALMLSVWIEHPDAEMFITMKSDLTKVTGANISVQVSDEFMHAVEDDKFFIQRFPVESPITKSVQNALEDRAEGSIYTENGIMYKKTKAKRVWDLLIKTAHKTAEPGIMFRDRHHLYSTSSLYDQYKNVTSNPCGEIMMGAYDSCRLIALNVYSYINEPFTPNARFNQVKWKRDVEIAQLLNDTIVDIELDGIKRIITKIKSDPEPKNIKQNELDMWQKFHDVGKNGRRTGLGFTGLGDAIAAMGHRYGSNDSIMLTEKIMKAKLEAEFTMSIKLAELSGPFEGWDPEIEKTSHFVQMMGREFPELFKKMMKHGRRNVSISTVAPTGSLSLLASVSSGIEPVFAASYIRRKKINPNDKTVHPDWVDENGDKWLEYPVYHEKLNDWAEITGNDIKDIERSPYHQATAPDISYVERVAMQAKIQDYTTHSISSTINLDKDVDVQVVDDIFVSSWKHGIKGVTVYRDGSRDGVLVTNKQKQEENEKIIHHAKKRPKTLNARKYNFSNKGEAWVGFIGLMNDEPYELFTGLSDSFPMPYKISEGIIVKTTVTDENGKHSKYDFKYIDGYGNEKTVEYLNRSFKKEYDDYAKLISGFMRHGMPLHSLDTLLNKIHFDGEFIGTWKAGVRRIIQKFIKMEEMNRGEGGGNTCPSCGDPDGMVFEDGCQKCRSCGFSKCG